MADLSHRATRLVDQDPGVVHDRVLELAHRLRDEAPAIPPGSQPAMLLGTSGRLPIQVRDGGPGRIELTTTEGRIRGRAVADIAAEDGGRTSLSIAVAAEPKGMTANLLLGAALGARPNLRQELVNGLEDAMTELAAELAKPDGAWDAAAWQPRVLADARR
jgi:hypothetical protein